MEKALKTLCVVIIFILGSSCMKNDYQIIFWQNHRTDLIDDFLSQDYNDLKNKYKPMNVIKSEHILMYYWDEQIIKIDHQLIKKQKEDGFILSGSGFFSVVLNNEVLFSGLNRTFILPRIQKYDHSNYPVIQVVKFSDDENQFYLSLKPGLNDSNMVFKDYPENEKNKLLDKRVLAYFSSKGKIKKNEEN